MIVESSRGNKHDTEGVVVQDSSRLDGILKVVFVELTSPVAQFGCGTLAIEKLGQRTNVHKPIHAFIDTLAINHRARDYTPISVSQLAQLQRF